MIYVYETIDAVRWFPQQEEYLYGVNSIDPTFC